MSDIGYPYLPETVPLWAVALYGILGPLLVFIFIEVQISKLLFEDYYLERDGALEPFAVRLRRFFVGLYNVLSLFFYGMGITLLLTEIGKRLIGSFRPHFLSVCLPGNNLDCITNQNTGSIYNAIFTGGSFCKGYYLIKDPLRY
jgi:hypothetical protein